MIPENRIPTHPGEVLLIDMIRELDSVVLTVDRPEYGLTNGDVGTVVLIHRGGAGYEVEFETLDGETVVVTSVAASQLRLGGRREIAHVRALDYAQV